jgi:hypothetical protein
MTHDVVQLTIKLASLATWQIVIPDDGDILKGGKGYV